jgi:conjugative relaxase-like TrwC/TraI family protein
MLSISKITSSKAAGSYYEKDDYYAKDDPSHQKQSKWLGQGAEKLGLNGEVKKEDFQNILAGKLPNGKMLGKNKDGEFVHDAGRDLTFSAPKSVSIMALIYNDERLIAAHSLAVAKTIQIIERDFLKTRTTYKEQVVIEQANNLVAATFKHFTSREQDPQLHTHTIIANATCDKNNFWKCAFFDEIYNNKKLIGAIYRSELAKEAKNLGYEIQTKGKDSLFELKCVPEELIKHFSTRSKQIREKAGEDASQKRLEQTTLKTRTRKKEGENLKDFWQEKLKNVDQKYIQPIKIPKEITLLSTDLKTIKTLAKEAVEYAINHLSERKTVFTANEIIEVALNDKLSLITINDINRQIGYLISKEDQLLITKKRNLVNYYTTKSALDNELQILSIMQSGQNQFKPVITDLNSKYQNLTKDLNDGQKKSAELILTTQDQFIGIQGYAGVGKTFMLNSVNQIAKKEGKTLIGLSPTGVATKNLENEAGIKSMTLQRFLAKYDGVANNRGTKEGRVLMQDEFKNKIIVVDESSMISTIQMKNLLTIAKELNFRIVFVGDIKQLDAVEAGIPFHEMQRNGLKTAKMTEILRQNNLNLKKAVYDTINSNIKHAFEKIDFNIREVKEEKIINQAVEEFLKLNHEQRAKTLILTPANETREKVNDIISNKLAQERNNQNVKEDSQIIFTNKNLTQTQKTKAYHYEVGDIVLFNKNKEGLDVKKNQYCQITKIDSKSNLIFIKNKKNQEVSFNPENLKGKAKQLHLEVFSVQNKIFRIGDKIAFNKAINKLRIQNSNQATITNITHDKITIKLESGRNVTFATTSNEIKHIDHSYSITAHKAQGLTCDNVIAVVESYRKHLTTQKNFYVSISRAKQNAIIITDHKANTINLLQKNTGIDISAIEHQNIRQNIQISKPEQHHNYTNNHQKEF